MVAMGKCIIILSNKVEDCEYYSKLFLFANEGLKCFGSIQDLMIRYAAGYMVSVEFNKKRQKKYRYNTNHLLAQRLLGTFPASKILEYHISYIKIYITDQILRISRIFVTLEAVRNLYDIDDYSICHASLEETLSRFNDSHEDIENIITRNRPSEIPYE